MLSNLRKKAAKTESAVDAMEQALAALGREHRIFWGDRLLTLDKSAGFMDEPRFAKNYKAIHGAHQYDAYNSPSTIAWRLHTLIWAAENALSLEGDFVECGVFKGDMSWSILECTELAKTNKRLYLYDSFEGFSPKYSSAADFNNNEGFFALAQNAYSEPGMYESVSKRFAPYPNVEVIKGFLPDSLQVKSPEKIAFLHIDLNSPAAEIGVLEKLFDRVVAGGYIVFDDYGWDLFKAQKTAEDAFMKARGHSILELPTGQGLVIKKS